MWAAYPVFKTENNDGDKDTILKHTTVYILIFRRLCLIKVDRCIIDCDIPPGGWLVEDAAGSKAGPAGTVRQVGGGWRGAALQRRGPRLLSTEERWSWLPAPVRIPQTSAGGQGSGGRLLFLAPEPSKGAAPLLEGVAG